MSLCVHKVQDFQQTDQNLGEDIKQILLLRNILNFVELWVSN
jgi:hypothetical protein